MRFLEKIGKNIDDLITDALIELGATRDEVIIDIIDKGSKGFFGIGARQAKVKVTVKEDIIPEEITPSTSEAIETNEIVHPVKVDSEEKVNKKAPKNEMLDKEETIWLAIDFLRKVTTEMGLQASFETSMQGSKLFITISGEKMGMVIGKRGETLDALQYLVNVAINKGNNNYIKVILDTENYRKRREETLKKVALNYAKKAVQLKKPVSLEPMTPYDRRVIHSILQNSPTVKTHSEGKEPRRKVVITPIQPKKTYKK